MDILGAYPDVGSLVNIFKYSLWALMLWLCTAALSGCGIKAGNSFVVGTTGFLEEVNRPATNVEHTDEERKQLSMVINRR